MIALIDGDYIPYIASYDKIGKEEKTLEECYKYTDDLIHNIFRETKCNSYILAFTVGKCFRYKIYSEYKGNRKYTQKLKYFKEVKQYLIDKYHGVFNVDLEADDIVSICSKVYKDSFIVSPDKDLLLLEGISYNPKNKEWFTISKSQANLKFASSLIVGDQADNIKGIKGLGPAYTNKLLNDIHDNISLLTTVFNSYLCNSSNIDNAIDEFYKNFKCLKIIDTWDGFQIPKPIVINNIIVDESKKRVVEE